MMNRVERQQLVNRINERMHANRDRVEKRYGFFYASLKYSKIEKQIAICDSKIAEEYNKYFEDFEKDFCFN